MIRKSCFLLALLQAVVSDEWGANSPRDVWPRRGLCARIPCRYTYPSHLANEPRTGIWYNSEKMDHRHIAFHSLHHRWVSTRFRRRTRLTGDLKSGDCSLVIDNISQQDEGPYFFRVEFDSKNRYNYLPVTWLHVSEFTDKPSIFPAEMVAGKPVKIRCSFNTICNGTAPTFTWVIPTDVPRSGSSSVTQRGDTLTYTSVLTLTPKLNHHGQTLTCRVRYASVSSAETVTLTVRYAPRNLLIASPDKVNNSWVSVREGNSAAILCSVQSFPASILTWRHLGDTLNTTSSTNKLWLEVPRVTSQLAGVYQCVAENGHGRVERNITLSVEYAPRNLSIASADKVNNSWVSVRERNSAAILCSVQSFPASILTWRHLGVTLNTTSSSNELWLEVPRVTSQLAGVYQCVAENEHGRAERTITLTVEHAPRNLSITSPDMVDNSWVSVKEGDSTMILCSVQSFPASNLTWRHLGVTLNATSSSNELWLEVPRVTPQLSGVHQCVAENGHGRAERNVTITVEHKPVISRESGCTRTSQDITCVCAARSNPPGELTWHLPVANLSRNQTHGRLQAWQVADGQLVTGSLTLRGGEGEEEATASCTVRNRHGEVTFKVYLWVRGGGFSVWMAVSFSIGVTLAIEVAGFFVYKYIRKRDTVTKERGSEMRDATGSCRARSAARQDTESRGKTPPGVGAGQDDGEGEEQCPVYANLRELSGGGAVHGGETVEYTELHFHQRGEGGTESSLGIPPSSNSDSQ